VQFVELLEQARSGNTVPLNQFFKKLYQKGKASLLPITKSETKAEECFQAAVTKFWLNCVEGEKPLPKSNVEGYIYSMAKFYCIDEMRKQQRSKTDVQDMALHSNKLAFSEPPTATIDQLEEIKLQTLRQKIIRATIEQLSPNCQRLFQVMLEEGIDKPKQLMTHLGLKEVRRVSVLKHECTKRLKVLTAIALEEELSK
jgi:RNA polymerase sigma factor (sigma-70 family)